MVSGEIFGFKILSFKKRLKLFLKKFGVYQIINLLCVSKYFNMNKTEHLKNISEIKQLMDRSSRFISLSGLSGILAGMYAIIGAAIAYFFVFPKQGNYLETNSWNFKTSVLIILLVAVFSVVTALFLSARKAKKNDEKIWDATTKRLLINFLIPFLTGGIYILLNLNHQHYGLTASLMLIFYGLSLVNASKYTVGGIKYLGIAEIAAGLLCAAIPGYGFWFWILGFGFFHIIYGSMMYLDEKKS